jgi:hypothetical protein
MGDSSRDSVEASIRVSTVLDMGGNENNTSITNTSMINTDPINMISNLLTDW